MQHQLNTSPAFAILNGQKVSRFHQQNSIRIQTLHKKTNEFVEKYVQKDEKGEPMTEDQEGTIVYKFETEEDKDDYLKELTDFMSISFKVNL